MGIMTCKKLNDNAQKVVMLWAHHTHPCKPEDEHKLENGKNCLERERPPRFQRELEMSKAKKLTP